MTFAFVTPISRRIVAGAALVALAWGGAAITGGQAQDTPPDCAGLVWLDDRGTPSAPPADAAAPAALPAWLTTDLTDACSGKSFALRDFAGKTLFVEAMATWCPTCSGQLGRLTEAASQLAEAERQQVVFVALSSEIGLPDATLAAYAEMNGFPFIFAVMPEQMIRDLAADMGQEIAVPPATPHFIVAVDGSIGELQVGTSSPEALLDLIAAAQPAG